MLSSSGLRPARTFAIAFKPSIIAPSATVTPFSTCTIPAIPTPNAQRPLFAPQNSKSSLSHPIRFASTASPASASSPSPHDPSPAPAAGQLTWNRFLELRRTRRKISVVASSFSAVTTTFFGLKAFMQGGYDATLSASLGIDPILAAGFSTIGFMAMGWLIGPFFGGALFNARYAGIRKDIESKERAFYDRIKRHRVDPTSSSMANPVPDYYGEKIGSVADYRRWLKDQRAFNLKRGSYQGNK